MGILTIDNTLAAAIQGDSHALATLYQNYEGLLKKASLQPHLLSISDEAFAEARLSFLEAIKNFDPARGVPFPGYAKAKVYGDLRTLFKRERRRWQREILPADTQSENGSEGSFWEGLADPLDENAALLRREAIRTALQKLPLRQQQLLRLLFFEEKTQKEAAVLLGISQQAAASMKTRALKNLRLLFIL